MWKLFIGSMVLPGAGVLFGLSICKGCRRQQLQPKRPRQAPPEHPPGLVFEGPPWLPGVPQTRPKTTTETSSYLLFFITRPPFLRAATSIRQRRAAIKLALLVWTQTLNSLFWIPLLSAAKFDTHQFGGIGSISISKVFGFFLSTDTLASPTTEPSPLPLSLTNSSI